MKDPRTIHFIGLGGIGMSGIARLYALQGWRVQGSDIKMGKILTDLQTLGVTVMIGHDTGNIRDASIAVYSSSISPEHPERVEAEKRGLVMWHRSDALAKLTEGKFTIAVTGTHGKTTTTSLIGMVLREAKREPTIVVGGWVEAFGGNAVWGEGKEIVIEADESDASFLKYRPDIEVVTNIEEEHMENYGTVDKLMDAYRAFLGNMKPDGVWFGQSEDARVRTLAAENIRSSVLYGFGKSAPLSAKRVKECPNDRRGVSFEVWRGADRLGSVKLKLLGRHNVQNALAAVGVAERLGIPFEITAKALGKFEGAGRRFDIKYEDSDYLVVDDYAHHPTEIKATLSAAKAVGNKRIVALFQPHRYSRTEAMLKDFGKSFFDADKLIVTDIYSAGETPRSAINGRDVTDVIRKAGHADVAFVERSKMAEFTAEKMKPGDLIIALGAGDIYEVAGQISEMLRDPNERFLRNVRGKILKDEPLSKHTTLRVGGPADYWVEPADADDLAALVKALKKAKKPYVVFGAGSNLLAPDEGFRGVVIHPGSPYFKEIEFRDGCLVARAGVPNSVFIQKALEHGLGGCEFLIGIPGVIGGDIAMNAGSHGQWIDSITESITVLEPGGDIRELSKSEIGFQYRHTDLKGAIVLEGRFRLPKKKRGEVQAVLDEYAAYRAATQDLQHPSAGCMFKNPDKPGGSSGQLIDEAGLKGMTIGKAQISPKHGNFIVNLGGATAADITKLMDEVREVIRRKYGITLEAEVRVL